MLIWVIFAAMAAAAVAVVLRPLVIPRDGAASRAAHEAAIYRDQLAELDRDRERGVVSEAEAKVARAEIGRRLIAASERAAATPSGISAPSWRRPTAMIVVVAVPAVALGLYLGVGSPGLPASPFAARQDRAIDQQDMPELVARVERHLQANPNDAEGWDVIAPAYMRMGRFDDAADAWRRAAALGGDTARRLAGLGESRVLAAKGMVDADARRAFEKAHALDPQMAQPRYYLGLAAAQDREFAKAVAIWEALVADAPEGAPWAREIERQVARAKQSLAGDSAPAPGPTEEDVAAAAEMTASERQAMIEGMVEGLATRLEEDGRDLDGWVRLARAYVVLGRRDDARAAIARARSVFAGEAAALERLNGAFQALGLGS